MRAIHVQQDNAGPHTFAGDAIIEKAGRADGWKIKMICQSPRSPDFNVLDLGYFHSIQTLRYQEQTLTTDQLISTVVHSFEAARPETLSKCFVTLQGVMVKVIEHHGHNDYKLPRIRSRYYASKVEPLSISIDRQTVVSEVNALVAFALSFA